MVIKEEKAFRISFPLDSPEFCTSYTLKKGGPRVKAYKAILNHCEREAKSRHIKESYFVTYEYLLPFFTKAEEVAVQSMIDGMDNVRQAFIEMKDELQKSLNEILVAKQPLKENLAEMVKGAMSSRMAIVREMSQSLNMLKEVRKFFIEDDYKKEVDRLEQFISLCERLKSLKEDGTLDAVTDIMIKLSLKEEINGRE